MATWFLLKPLGVGRTSYKEINCEEMSLREMYKHIGCRMVDIKSTKIPKVYIAFDDEYLLREEIPLPNMVASALYGDVICGNVLVAKVKNEDLVGFEGEELEGMRAFISKWAIKISD